MFRKRNKGMASVIVPRMETSSRKDTISPIDMRGRIISNIISKDRKKW
jgi:hypothetical protein